VAIVFNIDLTSARKQILTFAYQKNKNTLKTYLVNLLQQNYGNQWKQTVKELLEHYFSALNSQSSIEAANEAFVSNASAGLINEAQFLAFAETTLLPFAILYLDRSLKTIPGSTSPIKNIITLREYKPQEIGEIIKAFVTQIGLLD
jgi:hypothetical protein